MGSFNHDTYLVNLYIGTLTNRKSIMKPHQAVIHKLIAIILFIGTATLLYFTADSIGLTWDEPAYIPASQSYANWFELLFKAPTIAAEPAVIDQFWNLNHEHPPVAKVWDGLVWKIATEVFHSTNELAAVRLGSILMVAALVVLLYLLISERYGIPAGLFAAVGLLSMPRFFLHAHLASLDVPVCAMWFLFIFVFWKTVDRKGWAWGILWGFLWGLAVATKLNGAFMLAAPLLWCLFFRRRWSLLGRFITTGIVAVVTFFAFWPWLYHQTWQRILEYVSFPLQPLSDRAVVQRGFLSPPSMVFCVPDPVGSRATDPAGFVRTGDYPWCEIQEGRQRPGMVAGRERIGRHPAVHVWKSAVIRQ